MNLSSHLPLLTPVEWVSAKDYQRPRNIIATIVHALHIPRGWKERTDFEAVRWRAIMVVMIRQFNRGITDESIAPHIGKTRATVLYLRESHKLYMMEEVYRWRVMIAERAIKDSEKYAAIYKMSKV